MDIPRSAKVSGDRTGLSSGNAFKIGAWLITGVAGSLFLGRVLRETIRMGICSVVPLVVCQVMRKPAGSRRVITDQDSAKTSLHDRGSQFQDAGLAKRPFTIGNSKVTAQEREQFEIPVFKGQQSAENSFREQDEEERLLVEASFPVAEDRKVFPENKQPSSMSNAEWAAGLLDALEDESGDEDCLECREDEEQSGWVDARSDENLSDELAIDSLAPPSGGDIGLDVPTKPLYERSEVGTDEKTVREMTAGQLPEEKEKKVVLPVVSDRVGELESNANVLAGVAPRESDRISKSSYRRIPSDVAKSGVASSATSSFMPVEESHDAFSSAPFPGSSVPGVKSVENPFTRSDPAAVSVAKPGELASVILQGSRRSGKKMVGGNSMLVRMLAILLIVGGVSYCVFLANQALRGGVGDIRNSSYSIRLPSGSAPENISETQLGKPAREKKKNVSSSSFSESLAGDDHLPSFRSLE